MAVDGSIVIKTKIDNKDAEKELKKLLNQIDKLENDLYSKKEKQNKIKTALEEAKSEALKTEGVIRKLKMELAGTENITDISQTKAGEIDPMRHIQAIDRQKQITAELIKQENLLSQQDKTAEKIGAKYCQITDQVSAAKDELEDAALNAANLSAELGRTPIAGEKLNAAFDKAGEKADSFKERIGKLAKNIFVFTLINAALRSVKAWFTAVAETNDETSAAMNNLKAACLTLAQPLVTVLAPVLTAVLNLFTKIISAIAIVVSHIFGTTASNAASSAESLNGEANAIYAVAGAAKEAQRQLSGLDEMNKWQSDGAGGGGEVAKGIDFDSVKDKFNNSDYTQMLEQAIVYTSGVLLALGVILTLTGANIPLGLGLIAFGAVGLASELLQEWSTIPKKVKEAISDVTSVLGGALLFLGILLVFSVSGVALGLGLLVAGAAMLATAVAVNWDDTKNRVKNTIISITKAVSGALIALGAIFLFTGLIPLGLGFLVAGVIGIVASKAVNWTKAREMIQGGIAALMVVVSSSLLAVGIIFCLVGLFPLGIALIAAGVAGTVTPIAINWNAIIDKLNEIWNKIKQWWYQYIAPVFTLSFWIEKFNTIKEALADRLKHAANTGIAILNAMIAKINDKLRIEWGEWSILGKKIVSAGSYQLLKIPSIPYLAQGAVIPPNREFLAVLGDQKQGMNIEAPEDLIRKIVREEAGAGNYTFIAQLDGRTIFKEVISQGKLVQRMTGKNAFKLGGA